MRVAGKWVYLYRAIDSAGDTIDFLLSPNRDLIAAKGFLRLALRAGQTLSRVIDVDGHPAWSERMISEGRLRGRHAQSPNICWPIRPFSGSPCLCPRMCASLSMRFTRNPNGNRFRPPS